MNGIVALEKHYRVNELAALWRLNRKYITQLFRDEPGVIKFGPPHYITLSIPEGVAVRVHHSISQPPFKPEISRGGRGRSYISGIRKSELLRRRDAW